MHVIAIAARKCRNGGALGEAGVAMHGGEMNAFSHVDSGEIGEMRARMKVSRWRWRLRSDAAVKLARLKYGDISSRNQRRRRMSYV